MAILAGGPDENLKFDDIGSRGGYHCGTSRGSIERRRVPQVRGGNLGLGVVVSSAGVRRCRRSQTLNYMHADPVKRGLVKHPRDWAWSSWAYYFGGEKPLLAMDV